MSTWSFVKWNKVHELCRYRQLCHSTFLLQNSREARMSSGGSSWSTVAYSKLFKSSFHCWLWIALPCYQECSVSCVCAHKGNSKLYWLQRRYPSDIFFWNPLSTKNHYTTSTLHIHYSINTTCISFTPIQETQRFTKKGSFIHNFFQSRYQNLYLKLQCIFISPSDLKTILLEWVVKLWKTTLAMDKRLYEKDFILKPAPKF